MTKITPQQRAEKVKRAAQQYFDEVAEAEMEGYEISIQALESQPMAGRKRYHIVVEIAAEPERWTA